MIGLDTNILLRYLLDDDPVQSPHARQIIEEMTEAEPGYIGLVVMLETWWVLSRKYRVANTVIVAAFESILGAKTLAVQCPREVFTAVVALKEGRGSFADALIGELNASAGCVRTLTFDKKALRLPGYVSA
jgi:predicted nucleic-acid-binding protein